MVIDVGSTGTRGGVEGNVIGGDILPIIGEFVKGGQIQTGIARGVSQRGHDGIEIGLAG